MSAFKFDRKAYLAQLTASSTVIPKKNLFNSVANAITEESILATVPVPIRPKLSTAGTVDLMESMGEKADMARYAKNLEDLRSDPSANDLTYLREQLLKYEQELAEKKVKLTDKLLSDLTLQEATQRIVGIEELPAGAGVPARPRVPGALDNAINRVVLGGEQNAQVLEARMNQLGMKIENSIATLVNGQALPPVVQATADASNAAVAAQMANLPPSTQMASTSGAAHHPDASLIGIAPVTATVPPGNFNLNPSTASDAASGSSAIARGAASPMGSPGSGKLRSPGGVRQMGPFIQSGLPDLVFGDDSKKMILNAIIDLNKNDPDFNAFLNAGIDNLGQGISPESMGFTTGKNPRRRILKREALAELVAGLRGADPSYPDDVSMSQYHFFGTRYASEYQAKRVANMLSQPASSEASSSTVNLGQGTEPFD